jgi:hypothetical protein
MSTTPSPLAGQVKWDFETSIRRLKQASGEQFTIFVKDFERYARETTDTIISASPDQVLRVQGHAQQCQKLLMMFQDALR